MAGNAQPSGWSKFTASVSAPFKSKSKAIADSRTVDPNDPTSVFKKPRQLNAEFYISVARMQERAGNANAAATSYQKAIQLEPNNATALLDFAHLQDRQGAFAEAIRFYEKVVTLQPKNAAAHNDLGLCLARQGQLDRAVTRLQQAVKMQPERKLYRNNLATVLVEVGRTDEAYQQLCAAHPPEVAHYNLGYLLAQANQPNAAAKQFEAALQAKPDLAEARQWLDTLAQRSGDPTSPVEPQLAAPVERYASQQKSLDVVPERLPRALRQDERYEEPADYDEPPPQNHPHGSVRIIPRSVSEAPAADDDDEAPSPDDIDDYDPDRYEARNSGWSSNSPQPSRY